MTSTHSRVEIKIHLQDSMHQAHAHHPWSMHIAPPKSSILRAAQDPGGLWRLKAFVNSVSDVIWFTTKFDQILYFQSNFQIFMSIDQTRKLFKLFHNCFWGWYLQSLKLRYEMSLVCFQVFYIFFVKRFVVCFAAFWYCFEVFSSFFWICRTNLR